MIAAVRGVEIRPRRAILKAALAEVGIKALVAATAEARIRTVAAAAPEAAGTSVD